MGKFFVIVLICLAVNYPDAQEIDYFDCINYGIDLFDTNYFGIYSDTANDTVGDSIIIKKTHSLLIAEKKDYYGLPVNDINTTVWSRHSFAELPCVKSYTFYSGVLATGYLRHPSDMILFNTCDSSIYLYGDHIDRFCKIVKSALPDILKKNRTLKLLDLYFNVQYTSLYKNLYNGGKFVYLVRDANDFGAICNYFTEGFTDNLYDNDIIRSDIDRVKKVLVPFAIVKNENRAEVSINTWNWLTGDLKHWEFIISDENIIIRDTSTIIKEIGPHKLR